MSISPLKWVWNWSSWREQTHQSVWGRFLFANPRFSSQWILDMLGAQSWCFFETTTWGWHVARVLFLEFLKVRGINKNLHVSAESTNSTFFFWRGAVLKHTLTLMKNCRGSRLAKFAKNKKSILFERVEMSKKWLLTSVSWSMESMCSWGIPRCSDIVRASWMTFLCCAWAWEQEMV